MIEPIELPNGLADRSIPPSIDSMIRHTLQRIEAFQDRWGNDAMEQFVAADYGLVYRTLDWISQSQPLIGKRFIEWGCGFAAVAVMAAKLGWDSIGVETEVTLMEHGHETVQFWASGEVELVVGNFLPRGAEQLADDPLLPSLHHGGKSLYETLGIDLDDFAIVYSYPWPGEDNFHELVFDRYAAVGSILVHFRGPNQMAVWRKVSGGKKEGRRN